MEIGTAVSGAITLAKEVRTISAGLDKLCEDEEHDVAHAVCNSVIGNNDIAFNINEDCLQETIKDYCKSCKKLMGEFDDISKKLVAGTGDRGLYDSVRELKSAYGRFCSWHRTESNYASIASALKGTGSKKEKRLAKSFVKHLQGLRDKMATHVELMAEREDLKLRYEDLDRLREQLVLPGESNLG